MVVVIAVMVEGEQVHEIADRRAVFGHITGAVAEEVDRLDIAGIVEAAAFVGGDEDRRRWPKFGIALDPGNQGLQEFFRRDRSSSPPGAWPAPRMDERTTPPAACRFERPASTRHNSAASLL